MVVEPNTVPDPRAVMIKSAGTSIAQPTVLRSQRFSVHTVDAKDGTIQIP